MSYDATLLYEQNLLIFYKVHVWIKPYPLGFTESLLEWKESRVQALSNEPKKASIAPLLVILYRHRQNLTLYPLWPVVDLDMFSALKSGNYVMPCRAPKRGEFNVV